MLDEQIYRESLLDAFKNPQNRGRISKPDLEAKMVSPLCGDEVSLQIKLEDGRVEKAVFSGNGCAISQASASLLAESIVRKELPEIDKLKMGDILKLIGINPTPARLGCALLSLGVLKKALKEYRLLKKISSSS